MKYARNTFVVMLIFAVFVLGGCSTNISEDKTELGAVSGGVVGAGLGAIVGSATGDAGAGLVIGAAAGTATGAAIGHTMQEQDDRLASQNAQIEEHQRVLREQRQQIEELRKLSNDQINFEQSASNRRIPSTIGSNTRNTNVSSRSLDLGSPPATTGPSNTIQQPLARMGNPSEVTIAAHPPVVNNTVNHNSVAPPIDRQTQRINQKTQTIVDELTSPQETSVARLAPATKTTNAECQRAEGEMNKGRATEEVSDRLFYFRRALRLCPDSAAFHSELGKLYLSLNRNVDAEFEFQQALNIDPNYGPAKRGLANLR